MNKIKQIVLNLNGLVCQTIATASPQVIKGVIPYQLVLQFFIASRFCKSSQVVVKSGKMDNISTIVMPV